ncbi:MAG TPA: Dabb family protein [Acidimicrobiales bacterium]|nr:Dabb family protein [Acidimicrobiales bacterium]
MITHVVCFKLTDASAGHLAHCKALLEGLVGTVPTLRTMTVGLNVVTSPRAHDLVLIATYDDLDGLAAYRAHPKHVKIADHLVAGSQAIVSVDFES